MSSRRAPVDPVADGLREIDAWGQWFRKAHAERLASPWQFPDQHLAESEQQRIDALATAIVAKMKEEFLIRQNSVKQ